MLSGRSILQMGVEEERILSQFSVRISYEISAFKAVAGFFGNSCVEG
jgi:hypothetical protein